MGEERSAVLTHTDTGLMGDRSVPWTLFRPRHPLVGRGTGGGAPAASSAATAKIPAAMLTLYQQAASTCPGLPWTILAAIGTIESDNGQSNLPGVHSGANSAGAEGPRQFEPATFSLGDMRNTDDLPRR
jgi:hypothetical protein